MYKKGLKSLSYIYNGVYSAKKKKILNDYAYTWS